MALRRLAGRRLLLGAGLALALSPWAAARAAPGAPCPPFGWFPGEFGLKDHSVFQFGPHYYLASIYLHPQHFEDRFAYARSADFCAWEDLGPILAERLPGAWDESRIWAPFVFEEEGVYYMYYTGVTAEFTQSIMLATSTDPAEPQSWQPQGVIFQPDHPGSLWQPAGWADCRDPMVLKVGVEYYLYYTGMDEDGGIVGLATASAPAGPWADQGPVYTLSGSMPESPTVAEHAGWFYLFYTRPHVGGRFSVAGSPAGPWPASQPLARGWAHEVWQGPAGPYTSFLTNYTVTISPLTWDAFFEPAQPFIGAEVFHLVLPLVAR